MARIAVIGAGIVGLSCALGLARDGHEVAVVDPEPDGDKCSWGNAGGIGTTEVMPASGPGMVWRIPGWLLDPLGPVALRPAHLPAMLPWLRHWLRAGRPADVERIANALAALLSRVYDDLLPMLESLGLADRLFRRGALTVYDSAAARRRDGAEWALKRRHGIACEDIDGAAARAMEPALGPRVACAVFTPGWSHVADPKAIWAALLDAVRVAGAAVMPARVTDILPDRLRLDRGEAVPFDTVVIAAGAWSAALVRRIGDRVLLESERGYNTTFADPGITLTREVIFAERRFVATPLAVGLRIGGAAEFAGLTAPARLDRAAVLARLARDHLPGLAATPGTAWMGQRPATPDSLPVLGRSPRRANVIHAFGHGHLGLTLAATTARLVADLVAGRPAVLDIAPLSAARFSRSR